MSPHPPGGYCPEPASVATRRNRICGSLLNCLKTICLDLGSEQAAQIQFLSKATNESIFVETGTLTTQSTGILGSQGQDPQPLWSPWKVLVDPLVPWHSWITQSLNPRREIGKRTVGCSRPSRAGSAPCTLSLSEIFCAYPKTPGSPKPVCPSMS